MNMYLATISTTSEFAQTQTDRMSEDRERLMEQKEIPVRDSPHPKWLC